MGRSNGYQVKQDGSNPNPRIDPVNKGRTDEWIRLNSYVIVTNLRCSFNDKPSNTSFRLLA